MKDNQAYTPPQPLWSQEQAVHFEATQELLNKVIAWCLTTERQSGATAQTERLKAEAQRAKESLSPMMPELPAVQSHWQSVHASLQKEV